MFYKMISRDTWGHTMIPPKGAGFELLAKNLLHDSVDAFGVNNILRQADRQNISVRLTLERACEQISSNY